MAPYIVDEIDQNPKVVVEKTVTIVCPVLGISTPKVSAYIVVPRSPSPSPVSEMARSRFYPENKFLLILPRMPYHRD